VPPKVGASSTWSAQEVLEFSLPLFRRVLACCGNARATSWGTPTTYNAGSGTLGPTWRQVLTLAIAGREPPCPRASFDEFVGPFAVGRDDAEVGTRVTMPVEGEDLFPTASTT
jgi:hypothetical protein